MEDKTIEILNKKRWFHNYRGHLGNLNREGVFMLRFPNGKYYIGESSVNIGTVITYYFKKLIKKKEDKEEGWWFTAQEENLFLKQFLWNKELSKNRKEEKEMTSIKWWRFHKENYISIHYCYCENPIEYKKEILSSIENRTNFYNVNY